MSKFLNFIIVFFSLFIISCGNDYTAEQQKYVAEVEKQRMEKNEYMKNDPDSPFNARTKIDFSELHYYDVDPDFLFRSRFYKYPEIDTVSIFGTKGEERKVVRYGYITFDYRNRNYKVNVYKGKSRTGGEYYSIWFTDKTTGEDTYGVGRYIDFEMHPEADHIYTIDFNLAYNPYCAYSPDYSCAIPLKEDHIDLAIEAGEKKFH